jgi:mannose-6-phosphate isomerase-like protein (cupin superfamily)
LAKALSKQNALHHYQWGDGCDGWVLVDTEALSVKQERMPANTAETLHYHEHSQQFFFILKGTATFEVEGETFEAQAGEGFHIKAGQKHRIANNAAEDLEFVLSSQPNTRGDRNAAPVPVRSGTGGP